MAVRFSSWGNHQFVIPSTGAPASGYKLYTYVAGSSTLVTTYTTSAGNVAQTNPIVLNSAGFPTTGQIWITEGASVKFVFTDASDVVIKTEDNIAGVGDVSITQDQWSSSGLTPTFVSATSFTLSGDQTTAFHVGRRLKTTNTGGTIYSTITASTFGALTTVVVVNDSGTLDSGLSAVSYGLLSKTNDSAPRLIFPTIAGIKGQLFGLTLANNVADATNDIDIAAGVATDSTAAYVMTLASAFTKRLDANWAVGTNQGMRNSAAAIADTTYHIYEVMRPDTGVVDIYAHTSATVATVIAALQAEASGSAYTVARRIGSILRTGGALVAFSQLGPEFLLKTPVGDVSANNPGNSAVDRVLSVPLGVQVEAIITVDLYDGDSSTAASQVYISAKDQTDVAASVTAFDVRDHAGGAVGSDFVNSTIKRVRTDTAATVRSRMSNSSTDKTLTIVTHGWIDSRGAFG